jgi:hypothetical protein
VRNGKRTAAALIIGTCGILAITGLGAQADTRDDVLAGIARCGVIHDNRVWMDCVYGAQQPMRSLLGLPPAPEFQQRLVPPPGSVATPVPSLAPPRPMASAAPSGPAPVRRGRAGFLGNLFGANPPVAVARMTNVSYGRDGAFEVELENGQRWRQTDAEGNSVRWTKSPRAYEVTVVQGAFGSFIMHTDADTRQFKVERAK